jgi:hypothetical protein
MVIPVGVTLVDIGRQAQCRGLCSGLAFQLSDPVIRDGLSPMAFPACVIEIFMTQKSALISGAGIAGPALAYWLMRASQRINLNRRIIPTETLRFRERRRRWRDVPCG